MTLDRICLYAELRRRFDAGAGRQAIFDCGAMMVGMKRPVDAAAIYASLVDRFGRSQERAIREQVAQAVLSPLPAP